jgi:hypothetical protein
VCINRWWRPGTKDPAELVAKILYGTGRDYTAEGYHSDGGNLKNRDANRPNFIATKSRSFGFEVRAKARPKSISQVKMEQDLEMKRREQEAEHALRFVANKVPQ